ncbi:hypothetical protein JAAARDRAFT_33943 [Jaapia argillacea MUCL 33604]|uniref:UBX domain-containing protein n=1 Tax=Jaapia argillacea MUCL 33604 TaxID=933084 RepID=A0A067Q9D5_9AGAM|nr:hypothetical protein JAAARDRAFT_33943 [Jaapia argillacea MUCL 33604]
MSDPNASSVPTEPKPDQSLPVDFKVYNPPQSAPNTPRELSDAYFTPTSSDLKAAQAQLSARTNALVNAPLLTREVREAAQKSKLERWPTTTIRVKFPDRTMLEKSFPSSDKIRAVYAFVRSSLRDDVKPIKFILYQSPPKRDLKVSDPQVRDLSLSQLQLAPASILLLRFEDESLNHSSLPAPLLPSILSQSQDLPPPPDFDVESPPPSQSSTASGSSSAKTATTSGEKKIPKWLKLGQKK